MRTPSDNFPFVDGGNEVQTPPIKTEADLESSIVSNSNNTVMNLGRPEDIKEEKSE